MKVSFVCPLCGGPHHRSVCDPTFRPAPRTKPAERRRRSRVRRDHLEARETRRKAQFYGDTPVTQGELAVIRSLVKQVRPKGIPKQPKTRRKAAGLIEWLMREFEEGRSRR